MSRLEDPALIQELRDMRTEIDTLKAAQKLGGDSLLGYLTYTSALNDTSVLVPASTEKRLVLTFTFASAKDGAIIDLFPFYSIDNVDVMSYYVPPWGNGPLISMYVQPIAASATTMQWNINLWNSDTANHTAYFKFVFNGTDTGTWTLV